MIYQMAIDVAAGLQARKFPTTVVYAPEQMQREAWHSALIVFERDREQGDTIEAVRGTQRNARRVKTRMVGVKVDVLVKSGISGAMPAEHERECDAIVDGHSSTTSKPTIFFPLETAFSSDVIGLVVL